MACRGCARRRQALIDQFQTGLRVSSDISKRIAKKLNLGEKHDKIRLTSEGVIKQCSECSKQSNPAPTAGQIPPLSCDQCKK